MLISILYICQPTLVSLRRAPSPAQDRRMKAIISRDNKPRLALTRILSPLSP